MSAASIVNVGLGASPLPLLQRGRDRPKGSTIGLRSAEETRRVIIKELWRRDCKAKSHTYTYTFGLHIIMPDGDVLLPRITR